MAEKRLNNVKPGDCIDGRRVVVVQFISGGQSVRLVFEGGAVMPAASASSLVWVDDDDVMRQMREAANGH